METKSTNYSCRCLSEIDSIAYLKNHDKNVKQRGYEQSVSWLLLHIEYFLGDKESFQLLLISDQDSRDLAFLPLCISYKSPKRIHSIRPLSSYYTSEYSPVLLSEYCSFPGLADAVACWLLKNALPWDSFHFGPFSPTSEFAQALFNGVGQYGLFAKNYYWFDNWYLNCSSRSFEQYYNGLPSRLKNTISRRRKKFEKQGTISFRIYSRPEEISQAVQEFESVYKASWKKPEGKPDFIRRFSVDAADRDWTRIGILYSNSVPCAAQLWYVANNVASIFKLAHDEQFKSYSVGSLLTLEMMKYVLEQDKVTTVDFLIGGDGYKKDWGFTMQERHGLAIFNRTLGGRLLALRHISLPDLKRKFGKWLLLGH